MADDADRDFGLEFEDNGKSIPSTRASLALRRLTRQCCPSPADMQIVVRVA
jgi:hypothetical protein